MQRKLHPSSIRFRCKRKPREQDGAEGHRVPALWPPGTHCWLWRGVGCPLVMLCSYIQDVFLLNNQLLKSLGRTAACDLRRAKQISTAAVTAAWVLRRERCWGHVIWLLFVCVSVGRKVRAEEVCKVRNCREYYKGWGSSNTVLGEAQGLTPHQPWGSVISICLLSSNCH